MPATPDRWEQGSEFHWMEFAPAARAPVPWAQGLLLGSGRDALRMLVDHGARERGWERLWVPAYFCQEVVGALRGEGVELRAYDDHPLLPRPATLPRLGAGDALLVVNYFGLRALVDVQVPDGVDVIEDHTHDPLSRWAHCSRADYCVASIRKTFPVPDGGVLWSPRQHSLPAEVPVTITRSRASAAKFEAMILKRLYLAGHAVTKQAYRDLAAAGEAEIASGQASGMPSITRALLDVMPGHAWRAERATNHRLLIAALGTCRWGRVLTPFDAECVPFSAVLLFEHDALRERMRARLIERRVYPAVLWSLEEPVLPIPQHVRALSRRLLSIHCDMRYGGDDLVRVVRTIQEAAGS